MIQSRTETMIIGGTSQPARIAAAGGRSPPIPGMLRSSRIRSTVSRRSNSMASSPLATSEHALCAPLEARPTGSQHPPDLRLIVNQQYKCGSLSYLLPSRAPMPEARNQKFRPFCSRFPAKLFRHALRRSVFAIASPTPVPVNDGTAAGAAVEPVEHSEPRSLLRESACLRSGLLTTSLRRPSWCAETQISARAAAGILPCVIQDLRDHLFNAENDRREPKANQKAPSE